MFLSRAVSATDRSVWLLVGGAPRLAAGWGTWAAGVAEVVAAEDEGHRARSKRRRIGVRVASRNPTGTEGVNRAVVSESPLAERIATTAVGCGVGLGPAQTAGDVGLAHRGTSASSAESTPGDNVLEPLEEPAQRIRCIAHNCGEVAVGAAPGAGREDALLEFASAGRWCAARIGPSSAGSTVMTGIGLPPLASPSRKARRE